MPGKQRLTEEFLKLVLIDSVSGNERAIADVLIEKLEYLGLEVYEDEAGVKTGTTAGNIIAKLAGKNDAPVIMFCAHMDTVSPGEGILPVIRDGTVYSGGDTILGSDDKAGIAVILETLRLISESSPIHGGLEVVFTIKEEVGLLGAKNIDRDRLEAKMGFVLDSDGDPGVIVIRGPSQDKVDAVVVGKAAHAGINPEDGVDALQVAAHAICGMRLGRIDEETTANVGMISGGNAVNIVPEKVVLRGEARSLADDKRTAQTEHMCKVYRETAKRFGAKVELDVETIYPG
ncbi:MAG TPA: M20/M25/M40 family metallo-hydrolase, partial [Clostridia bacterium]|nr:M20/M25/M40 family metallo-hydrolase [Clostridia bacterium]